MCLGSGSVVLGTWEHRGRDPGALCSGPGSNVPRTREHRAWDRDRRSLLPGVTRSPPGRSAVCTPEETTLLPGATCLAPACSRLSSRVRTALDMGPRASGTGCKAVPTRIDAELLRGAGRFAPECRPRCCGVRSRRHLAPVCFAPRSARVFTSVHRVVHVRRPEVEEGCSSRSTHRLVGLLEGATSQPPVRSRPRSSADRQRRAIPSRLRSRPRAADRRCVRRGRRRRVRRVGPE
jgi:hypothetical protein